MKINAAVFRDDSLRPNLRGIIQGNSNPAVFIPMLVDFFMGGRFPLDKLVRFYPFEAIAQAFHDSEAGVTVKPILRIG